MSLSKKITLFSIIIAGALVSIIATAFGAGLSDSSIACLVVLLILSVIVFSCVVIFIRKNILQRVASLSSRVRVIIESRDLTTRLKINGDELDELTGSINDILDSLVDHEITAHKHFEGSDRIYHEPIGKLNTELYRQANDLAAANVELESFNYSVSHDMRGPLTRISGYCQLMLEDDAQLDLQSKIYLTRIYESSCWLDEMINAKLSFSHLTSTDFITECVDLSSIAAEVLRELALTDQERLVEIDISPQVMVEGDFRLLRIFMTNLLGNAWKYSACKEQARIEFGALADQPNPVYFVKDNGADFDMQKPGKMFHAFSRLHDAAQFTGNSTGLATVQHIVTRHGGKIWAEGEPENGATFFFTLRRDDAILPA